MCVLTLDSEGESLVQEVKDKEFEAVLSLKDKDLSISLSGRLDTITAPDLLGKYENIPGKEALSSITVDAKDLQYISSAGLRVMMIMYKGLAGEKNFHMVNVSKDVKEILEVTGFSQFLI
ncbi:MAG: STAS domain-containing protein [Lachnospiraceae bacterium]|nr:STAS domain-containing protein [Lachnospiraceae bacterium]